MKTILITGSTDGIGFETAKMLLDRGERVLLHGRNQEKLDTVEDQLSGKCGPENIEAYCADLSVRRDVDRLAMDVAADRGKIDVLINNAGVLNVAHPITESGLDVRFVVNTLAPYLLTKRLLPHLGSDARVVSLSSAAQSPVDIDALHGKKRMSDNAAYAQSKLALTMWSKYLADQYGKNGPVFVAVNPASLLGSKMVRTAYGVDGGDLRIGADILVRAALSPEFAEASGKYYDNDRKAFASSHPDVLNAQTSGAVIAAIESILESDVW